MPDVIRLVPATPPKPPPRPGSPEDALQIAAASNFESVMIVGYVGGHLSIVNCDTLAPADQLWLLHDVIDEVRATASEG